jgi:hypothetical protein
MCNLAASAETNSAPLHALLIVFACLAVSVVGLFAATGLLAVRNKRHRLDLLADLRTRTAAKLVAAEAERDMPPSAESGTDKATVEPAAPSAAAAGAASVPAVQAPAAEELSAAARRIVANLTTGDLVLSSELARQVLRMSEQDASASVVAGRNNAPVIGGSPVPPEPKT